MAASRPRLFTIPSSVPFLPTLVTALAEGRLVPGFPASDDPLALAAATIYLPTRRACRLAREVFLDGLAVEAAVLPRLIPIGDVDEDELAFADAAAGALAAARLDLPPAIGELERRLLLAQLILRWSASAEVRTAGNAPLVANGPTAALALADALARLMDDMTLRGVSWDRLDGLVPERLDPYWQLTLRFLQIAREAWPAILVERGRLDPAARRDRLIAAEEERLRGAAPGPVIAAGSTASLPATAALLATIAGLPHGAVVLPGLDTELDQPSWDLIAGGADTPDPSAPAAGHPQFAMQAFLARLGVGRDEVATLGLPAAHGRERLISEALRPAAATHLWRDRLAPEAVGAALAGVSVVEAANPEQEALAIAVALRQTLEVPGATAALVTADRGLARRVTAALDRWNVAVDDSGGDPLADTPAGVFARLVAETALGGLAPVPLLALLKHPLLRLGEDAGGHAFATRVLERALLRGPRPSPGTAGLAHALATLQGTRSSLYRSDPRSALSEGQLALAAGLVARLQAALGPLEALANAPGTLAGFARQHEAAVLALARDGRGNVAALAGEDGTALDDAFEAIAESVSAADFMLDPAEYADFFRAALADRVVRRAGRAGARVRVFGLLEARLQDADRMVLGGLVEGTWPPQAASDPWLSRPMRHQLGLDLPERRIGLTAHDFAQALGARDVILTRAAKVRGTPSVASRFMQRLAAVAGEPHWQAALARGARYVELAESLDRPPGAPRRIKAPAPSPPRAVRPTRLSVTEIEHWLRDPYTIYAKHVLDLARLDPVDTPPGARDRGTLIHGAIGEFAETHADGLPPDPLAALMQIGERHFEPLKDYPEAKAFWWPRFRRIARWFVAWERRRRGQATRVHAEIRGEIAFALGARRFTLTTRADRVEQGADGSYQVLDYKTGQAASAAQVRTGLAPQLTLEAAILRRGGFAGIPAGGSVAGLAYVLLKGGEPPGKECAIAWDDTTADAEADRALARLQTLAARFEEETTPYRSLVRPMWSRRYGDYDHLARVKEWSATGGEDEAGPE